MISAAARSWLPALEEFFDSIPEEQRESTLEYFEKTFPAFLAGELEELQRRESPEVRRGPATGPSLWSAATLAEKMAVRAWALRQLQSYRDGVPTLLGCSLAAVALPLQGELRAGVGESRVHTKHRKYINKLREFAPGQLEVARSHAVPIARRSHPIRDGQMQAYIGRGRPPRVGRRFQVAVPPMQLGGATSDDERGDKRLSRARR